MILAELITPNSSFVRSVNLERDLGDGKAIFQYFLTGKGFQILSHHLDGKTELEGSGRYRSGYFTRR
jgi:hypothetical protein